MKKVLYSILFALTFLSGFVIENTGLNSKLSFKDASEYLNNKLNRKLDIQKSILNDEDLMRMINQFDVNCDLYKNINGNHLAVFAYRDNCLTFWTNNQIHPFDFKFNNKDTPKFIFNQNGWFQVVSIKKKNTQIYCFYRFYEHYPFNNEYFVDGFNKELGLNGVSYMPPLAPTQASISGYSIYDAPPLVDNKTYELKKVNQIVVLLYLLSVLFFILLAFNISYKKKIFDVRKFIIYCTGLGFAFSQMIFFNWVFKNKSNLKVFTPELAAFNEWIPSLGHGILLFVSLVFLLLMLQQLMPIIKRRPTQGIYLNVFISALFWSISSFLFIFVLPKYILNSQINYNFKSLANINLYSILGMFTVFLMFVVLVLVTRILAALNKNNFVMGVFMKWHFITGVIIILNIYFITSENGFLLICYSVFGLLWALVLLFPSKIQFRNLITFALLTASFLAVQFEQLNSYKEKEHRKLFANKLISKEDIDIEYNLLNVEREMLTNSAFDSLFYYSGNNYDELELNYKFTFFNSFIRNFDIDFLRFDSLGNDLASNKFTYEYVNSIYNKATNRTVSNYFLYIKDLHYLGGYLAKYEICPEDQTLGYLFLILIPKVKSDLYNLDYFFSKNDYDYVSENQYSYAIYQKNELVKGLGEYPFKLSDDIQYRSLEDASFFEQNGYSQLFKKIDDETFVIVSLKADNWNKKFTQFTFILLYFIGAVLIVYTLIYLLVYLVGLFKFIPEFNKLFNTLSKYFRTINIENLYLETQIRLSFLLISILICSVVIYFTVQNVNRSFKEKQSEDLDKKMSQILTEIELGYKKKSQRPIQILIKHLAGTYEVDINIYLRDGTLYQTANNRIYYEGWFSPYIQPLAHYDLIQEKKFSSKRVEKIGELKYQSYYSTLFDENRQLIGYVHLPYFSKSLDLKNEFSNYLGSLLNISTLLLMISLLISSYIGRSLVRPLKLMIDSLAKIRLGEHNKTIDWIRNDEIGQLVDQYNVMLKKLEDSTELLAQSEREGAWKEMAKQVAHEIKNPLTPMKLHLQHLQMSINRDDDGIKEKVSNISRILIEQIDHLSKMAEEFSSFAKMPQAVLEECNLFDVVNSCITLFRSQNNLEIDFEYESENVPVFIDKSQMQRVFTNILKNAHQAVDENESCKILVTLELIDEVVKISFQDNGTGIPEELKDKIFQPSFSTKNSGMGLGLAICKKIVEQVHGHITFSSEINKGTTFYVVLPIYKNN